MSEENQKNELLKGPVILTVPACVTGSISHKPRKNVTSLKWSNRSRNDMSTFGFTLTLLLLGTIGAVQTDNPMFWLLIGPAPFAVVLTGLVFFRQGFSPRGMGKPLRQILSAMPGYPHRRAMPSRHRHRGAY